MRQLIQGRIPQKWDLLWMKSHEQFCRKLASYHSFDRAHWQSDADKYQKAIEETENAE